MAQGAAHVLPDTGHERPQRSGEPQREKPETGGTRIPEPRPLQAPFTVVHGSPTSLLNTCRHAKSGRDSLTLVNAFLALDGRQGECTVTACCAVTESAVDPGRDRRWGPLTDIPGLVGGRAVSGLWRRVGQTVAVIGDIYRVRRARFASIVWDRDWLRCLDVTV